MTVLFWIIVALTLLVWITALIEHFVGPRGDGLVARLAVVAVIGTIVTFILSGYLS